MKQKFLKHLEEQLFESMNVTKVGAKISDADKYRCEGFMQADVELEIVTDEEIQALIRETHESVFGESIIERRGKEKLGKLH